MDRFWWYSLGLTGKFRLVFSLLFTFIVIVVLTGYLSFRHIQKLEEDIHKSIRIGHLVLEMDLGHEEARHLISSFFLQYQQIGLQEAHERYAQPSVRKISNVILLSSQLKDLILQAEASAISGVSETDINVYLASARRFADTSIEAVELISERSAPERGLQDRLRTACLAVAEGLQTTPDLLALHKDMVILYKEYLVNRQRPFMQSALNVRAKLRKAIQQNPTLERPKKEQFTQLLDHCAGLAAELLDTDLAIFSRINDFFLQEETLRPISKRLIEQTRKDVTLAEEYIEKVHRITSFILLSVALLAFFVVFNIARLMYHSVTKNVLDLSAAAHAFSSGNLDVRVAEKSGDELGQLAAVFNSMAAKLKDLVENLERKVEQRTAELSASDWIWEVDRDEAYTFVSPQVEKILGYRPEDLIGKTPFDFMPPGEAERVSTLYRKSAEEKKSLANLENSALHRDGHQVFLETSGTPFFDEKGELAGYRGIDRDISERKKVEEENKKIQVAVSSAKAMWEHTFDTIPLMISILNDRHEIIRMNRAMADALGQPIEKLLHTHCYKVVHGTDAPPDYCPHSKLLIDHKVHTVEIFEPKLNAHLAVTVAPLFDENKGFLGSVHIAQDISHQKVQEEDLKNFNERLQEMVDEKTREIKEREKQLLHAEKLSAVGRFSASIAHEFNNPLQGVLNVVRGVRDRATLSEQDEELIELAVKECFRMKDLIQNLQQFNRPTSGIRVEVNIHKLMDEVLLFTKKEFKNKEIAVTKEYMEDLPHIWAVADQIKQVFMNILSNGCDAIGGGRGTISISTTLLHGERIAIEIEDSGEGIRLENIKDIFEPFYSTKAIAGTGLGLSTSYGIVKSHGGDIDVDSEPGLGTTFTITLPIGMRQNHG
ncbi:MAG: PAS domain S-box protein [Thermodesulfobacteriota bacterium]